MRKEVSDLNIKLLKFQRNIFIAITFILLVTQLVTSFYLCYKKDKVIITPATINNEFWIDNDSVSASYLEQFGSFIAQLALSKSYSTAQNQRMALLRHTDISMSGKIEKKLIEEEKKLVAQRASYSFFPTQVNTNTRQLEVTLYGERTFYVSDKEVSRTKGKYTLKFTYNNHRLLLKDILNEFNDPT